MTDPASVHCPRCTEEARSHYLYLLRRLDDLTVRMEEAEKHNEAQAQVLDFLEHGPPRKPASG